MGSRKQRTLFETWGHKVRNHEPVGSGTVINDVPNSRTIRGRGVARIPRGRGRGSKRGKTTSKRNNRVDTGQTNNVGFEDDDEDDNICELALSNFELASNDVSKAFEAINASTELPGFDKTAGDIWIYPTNKPVRDYQFNIVQTALYNNTLVSLPTGLGKTFIAAVVMFNFHRWYPKNLIIFMAPTRPLVTQQLEACHELMGIAPSKMLELTGQTLPKKREVLWKEKTVFFLTPQVLASDLSRGYCPADQVRCIVVDEAHKALGNHAFVQVIKMLSQKSKYFRVLALSATPGSDIEAVQEVFKNLTISKVELRSENSPDILPYTHQKQVEKIIVPLDDSLNYVLDQLVEVFQQYTGKLMKLNVLFGRDGSSFTQFQLLRARELYRSNPPTSIPNYQRSYIEVDFATCITLAHAIDLIVKHGLRSFYSFLRGVFNKEKSTPAVASDLRRNTNLEELLSGVQSKLNISVENSRFDVSNNGLFTTISENNKTLPDLNEDADYLSSHPKMRILKDLILKHFHSFQSSDRSTRVMIFSQYRDSVQEIGNMLNSLRPLVKPMVFIGQAKTVGGGCGLKQKDQAQVLQTFRDGQFNVLVSTCVGEEGLDIGEVDLIICFDANKSPTRLVQRMGRTGRQRSGKTIFLLTKGREERMYSQSIQQHSSISKTIVDPRKLQPYLYKYSPRMVPAGFEPQCFKMEIILSSEQKQNDEKNNLPLVAEQFSEDVDFVNPVRQKFNKTKALKKNSKLKGISDQSSAGTSTSMSSNKNDHNVERTRQCFLSKKNGNELCIFKSTGGDAQHDKSQDSDCMVLEDVPDSVIEPENDNDYKFLCDIFDVKDDDKNSTAHCIFIPKVPKPIKWLQEYNEVNREDVLANSFELQCLQEKLNAIYMLGPDLEHCGCGLPNADYFGYDFEDEVLSENNISNDHSFKCTSSVDLFPECSKQIENTDLKDFVFEENDPIFDDDWSGETPDIFIPAADTIKNQECHSNNTKSNNAIVVDDDVICIDDDDSSTMSDEAFQTIIRSSERSQNSGIVRLIKENDFVRFVCEPSSPNVVPLKSGNQEALDELQQGFTKKHATSFNSPLCSTPKKVVTKDGYDIKIVEASPTGSNSSKDFFSPSPIKERILPRRPLRVPAPSKKFHFKDNPSIKRNPANCAIPVFGSESVHEFRPTTGIEVERPEINVVNRELTHGLNSQLKTSSTNRFHSPPRSEVIENNIFQCPESPDIFEASPVRKKFKFTKGVVKRVMFTDCEESPIPHSSNSVLFSEPQPSTSKASMQNDILNNNHNSFHKSHDSIEDFEGTFSLPHQQVAMNAKDSTHPSKMSSFTKTNPNISRTTSLITKDGWYSTTNYTNNHIKPLSRNRAPKKTCSLSTTRNIDISKTQPSKSILTIDSAEENDNNEDDIIILDRKAPKCSIVNVSTKRTKKNKRKKVNIFVRDEAEVSGTDDSTADENDDLSDADLDQFDSSFVSQGASESVSESQQIRYMRSVKDIIPVQKGRIEKPLELVQDSINYSLDNEYEEDSFCVDVVEYTDVGVYTQAMICAREELGLQNQNLRTDNISLSDNASRSKGNSKEKINPVLRPKTNLKSKPTSSSSDFDVEKMKKPHRRRIITYSDEDE